MNGWTGAQEQEGRPRKSESAPRRSVRWRVGVMAAALVVAATGCTPMSFNTASDLASPTPVPAPEPVAPADLEAAQAVAAAFAAHDADAAAHYTAPDRELSHGWVRHLQRDAAWGVEYLMEPCIDVPRTSFAAEFSCPFTMHAMGSRAVGAGPFPDNALIIRVDDGKVLSADAEIAFDSNGLAGHLDEVFAWLEAAHPDDVALLGSDELAVGEDEWPAWLELWKRYIAEYVEANTSS